MERGVLTLSLMGVQSESSLGWINDRDTMGEFKIDWELCLTDFSQIELRILAHLSGDPELLKLFQESERDDVFSTLTSQW